MTTFNFSSANYRESNKIASWSRPTGFTWSDNDTVTLSVTVPAVPPPAPAETVVSNRSETAGSGVNNSLSIGTSFTTGNDRYTVNSVTIPFIANAGSPTHDIGVAIHPATSATDPRDSALSSGTLSGPNPTGAGNYTFTSSAGVRLEANTTYFLMISNLVVGTDFANAYRVSQTASDNQTASIGWAIGDDTRYASGTKYSDESIRFSVAVDSSDAYPGNGQAQLTWKPAPTGAAPEGWEHRQKTVTSSVSCHQGAYGDWQNISDTPSQRSHVVTSLNNTDTLYCFQVRAKQGGAASAPLGPVVPRPNTPAYGAPKVHYYGDIGVVQGATLTATRDTIADHDGLTLLFGELTDSSPVTYQWLRRSGGTDTNVSGATARTYEVTKDDVGKTLKVKVSFKNDGGNSESRTSAASDAIAADPCVESITADGSHAGQWADADNCKSQVADRGNARYYTFTLSAQSDVTITLDTTASYIDGYLYLRSVAAKSGTALHENDDMDDNGYLARISAMLAAGAYTIETATCYDESWPSVMREGSFTLGVSGIK